MFHSGAGETRRMRMKPIIYGPQWKPLFAPKRKSQVDLEGFEPSISSV